MSENYRNYIKNGAPRNLLADKPTEGMQKEDYYKEVGLLQRNKFDIRNYITVVDTKFMRGTRPFTTGEATGTLKPTGTLGGNKIGVSPLSGLDYDIKTFLGFLELTDEQLEDSEEATMDFITMWIAQYELNTYMDQVFNGAGVSECTGIFKEVEAGGSLEGRTIRQDTAPSKEQVRGIFNLELSGLLNSEKKIFTNSTGFNCLESILDGSGNSLVTKDAGGWLFMNRRLIEVPKQFFKDTDGGETPFILGDLKALYKMHTYGGLTLESSGATQEGWKNSISEVKASVMCDGSVSNDNEAVKIIFSKLN